jgi:hypothetical protein
MPRPRGFEPYSIVYPVIIRKELAHVPGGAYVTMVLFATKAAQQAYVQSLANNDGYPGRPIVWGDANGEPPFQWYNSKAFIIGMWNSFA